MERREAPGRCATAPLGVPVRYAGHPARLACEAHPEARAGGDLRACEALPPNRCASRRSTPQASVRSLRWQHGRIVGGRTLPGRAAPHECAGWLSKAILTIILRNGKARKIITVEAELWDGFGRG